jgi:hypothetical protein
MPMTASGANTASTVQPIIAGFRPIRSDRPGTSAPHSTQATPTPLSTKPSSGPLNPLTSARYSGVNVCVVTNQVR